MKNIIIGLMGTIGSIIVSLFGGWSTALATLLIFMCIDFITGIITALLFSKSPKTRTGGLNSLECFKGLCKKCMILMFVIIGYRIDITFNMDYVKNGIIIAFIINEALSIIENSALMGVPVPALLLKALDILKNKEEDHE